MPLSCDLAMFALYWIVKSSAAETDGVQCEKEQVPCCVADITSFTNGANESCSGAKLI